jgi:hypothetical protein
LYDKFDFHQPWDSPQNKALIAEMPAIYKAPGTRLEVGHTVYLGVLGGELRDGPDRYTTFAAGHNTNFADLMDGSSNTIIVVEADPSEAAIWTRPDDWEFDPQAPRRGLGSLRKVGFTAAFADAAITLVPNTVTDEDLRRLFLIRDGRPFESYGRQR